MGSIITLDNFITKISKLDESSTNQLYGLVDIGSNGIRCSISDLTPPQSRLLSCIYSERAGISLYDSLHENKPGSRPFYFSEETITQVSEILRRFKRTCDEHEIPDEQIAIFATEAMRTAKNQDQMLQAIKKASNLTVDILSPEIESLFGAMGVRSGLLHVDGLVMDLGGGSVQMTYLNDTSGQDYYVKAAEAAKSMPFGAAKLVAALSNNDTAEAAKAELGASMKTTFKGLLQKFSQLRTHRESEEGVVIYLCGGGFRGYGSILMHTDPINPYPIPMIGGYTVSGDRFVKSYKLLLADYAKGEEIYGISKRRRQQFPAIALVVQALAKAIPRIKSVTFCAGGNREGVLFMKLSHKVRECDPFSLFPAPIPNRDPSVISSIACMLSSALPSSHPPVFTSSLLGYVARNIWVYQGQQENASRALHECITGHLAGLPGLTHEMQSIIALTLAARWGSKFGPVDIKVVKNLQLLVGTDVAWWCQYLGTASRFLANIFPAFPKSETTVKNILWWQATFNKSMGKKENKEGIKLSIYLDKDLCKGFVGGIDEVIKMWGKVGKGLSNSWKIEAIILEKKEND